MEKRGINIRLNFLKGIACIGVVFMHFNFPGLFGQIVNKAAGFAVPIFYMIAGYYAYGKNTEVIKRRTIKIIKIFVVAYALFFLYYLFVSASKHEVLQWLANNYNWKTPIKYIWFCTIDFAIPLWYLIAMIETYMVWYFVVKKEKEQFAIKFTLILFLLQIILTSYCETMQLEWFLKINFLTRALPWFMLGYYLNSEKAQKVREIKKSTLIVLSIIGCAIVIIPTAFNLPLQFNAAGYIPFAFGLFSLALKNPSKSICKPIEFIGDKLSLYIYILHVLTGYAIGSISTKLFKINPESYIFSWAKPIIVLVFSIGVAWIVYRIKIVAQKQEKVK